MQWSSKSIARLAAALAKAQAALVNPEKSLVATIHSDDSEERTFRYASLASGLDIVRTTLSKHAIAVVQTTAVEGDFVKLTTVLAHSSGEWIASDWPVCSVKDIETPHRMGAALTYARRYALFTLVGIAGEDDLDAPDLAAPSGRGSGSEAAEPPNGSRRLNGDGAAYRQGDGRLKAKRGPRSLLRPEASAELRDRLLSQIAEIGSADDAALWAYCNIRAKNGLSAADALQVEEAFQGKLAGLTDLAERPSPQGQDAVHDGSSVSASAAKGRGDADAATAIGATAMQVSMSGAEQPPRSEPAPAANRRRARRIKPVGVIDKVLLTFPEPRRIRDREHVRFVAKQPCLVCGRIPSDPHHLRFAQSRALGRKVSDEFTVPLCRGHHREVHRCGDEAAWWANVGIEPTAAARRLWLETHPLRVAADNVPLEGHLTTSPTSIRNRLWSGN